MKQHLNKTFLGLAILSASTVGFAEEKPTSKFYGSFRLGIDTIDAGTSDDGANGRDYLSRIGFKTSVSIKDGLEGLVQVEYGLRSDNLVDFQQDGDPTLRLAMIGLKGNWGEVYYGSQTLLWHKFVRSSYFSDGLDTVRQGAIRDDDLLQYYYKKGGFTLGLGTQTEGQDGDSFDQFQIGGEYVTGPIKLQAAYSQDERGDNTGGLWGLRAWWTVNKHLQFSAYTHQADEDYDLYTGGSTGVIRLRDSSVEGRVDGLRGCSREDRNSTGVYGKYSFGSNQIHTRYAVDSCDDSGDVDSIKVEYIYFLNKYYRVWVAYEDLSNDDGRTPSTSSGDDFSLFQVGARADF